VVRLNKPTSTGGDDPKEIHYQKTEYKIVEGKSLRTQSPNTPKSHYHTIEIILPKTELQTLLLLEIDEGWSLFFYFLTLAPFYFSLSLEVWDQNPHKDI